MATGGQETLGKFLESTDPDVGLMLRVREDDNAAFEELVGRYQNRLIGLLAHMIGSRQEAEDLAQEVFLRVYRARKGYKPQARFSTWLFRMATNLASNHLRGKGRNPVSADASGARRAVETAPGPQGTASAQMRQVELEEIVREAVAALDDDQRLAVLLSKFEEMRYSEIAAVMNRSEAAVKSLLSRARLRLRDRLEPYLQTGRRG
ncbi:MAG: sigma-70 family RNA polymerase sigma factor [Isosphaeraceae bacterium]